MPSWFTGNDSVDGPAGDVDEAQVRGKEEGEEVAGTVAPEHDDRRELLDRRGDGADDQEGDDRLNGRAPTGSGAVAPGESSRAWPRRWAAARWPDSGATHRQHVVTGGDLRADGFGIAVVEQGPDGGGRWLG